MNKVLIDIDEFRDWLKDEVYKTDLSEVMPIIDFLFENSKPIKKYCPYCGAKIESEVDNADSN